MPTAPRKTVQLLMIDPALVDALQAPGAFEQAFHLQLGASFDYVRDLAVENEVYRRTTGAPPEWGGYLAVDPSLQTVVGVGGYKGAPDAAAEVEIAYGTFPTFEGQGYAGATATALVARAEASGQVRRVRAHTLPMEGPSPRVLSRLGFECVGTVIDDPEDGPVWRWERAVPTGVAADCLAPVTSG